MERMRRKRERNNIRRESREQLENIQQSQPSQTPETSVNLEDLLNGKEEGGLKEQFKYLIDHYSRYILIVKKDESSYKRLKSFIDEVFRSGIKDLLQVSPSSVSQENINEIKEQLETNFKLILANLLLSNIEIVKQPESNEFKEIINFINEKLSINDLIFLNELIGNRPEDSSVPNIREISIRINNEDIFSDRIEWIIQEYWQPYLIAALTNKVKDKENLEEYLKKVIDYYIKNLDKLRENLMQSKALKYELKEELRRELGREPSEKELNKALENRVNEIIESLEAVGKINLDEIMKGNPEQLKAVTEYFESFNKQIEEANKEGKKIDFKKFWLEWSEKLKNILNIIGVGIALWGVLFAFFLPVYFVEKVKDAIKL